MQSKTITCLIIGVVMQFFCQQSHADFPRPYRSYWIDEPVAARQYYDNGSVEIFVGRECSIREAVGSGGRIRPLVEDEEYVFRNVAGYYTTPKGYLFVRTMGGQWYAWQLRQRAAPNDIGRDNDLDSWYVNHGLSPDRLMTFEQGLMRRRMISWIKAASIIAVLAAAYMAWRKRRRKILGIFGWENPHPQGFPAVTGTAATPWWSWDRLEACIFWPLAGPPTETTAMRIQLTMQIYAIVALPALLTGAAQFVPGVTLYLFGLQLLVFPLVYCVMMPYRFRSPLALGHFAAHVACVFGALWLGSLIAGRDDLALGFTWALTRILLLPMAGAQVLILLVFCLRRLFRSGTRNEKAGGRG
jgi:hypothetical protein